jgi:hypothetical protein
VTSPSPIDGFRSTAGATVDVVVAFASLAVVLGLPLVVANEALGTPLASGHVEWAVAVVALGGAYPFVAGDWSLAKLTDFALAAILTSFALAAFVSFGLLGPIAGGLPSDSPVSTAVRLAVIGASFAAAAGYVRRRERRHVSGSDADAVRN